jgi:hypothetical protein
MARERAYKLRMERKNRKFTEDFVELPGEMDYREVKENLDYKEPWHSRMFLKDVIYESESEEG